MRLAIFHNQPPGGARRALYELGKRLGRWHAVDVFTLSSADERTLSSRDFARRVVTIPYQRRPHLRLGFYLNDYRTWLDLQDLHLISRRVAERLHAGGYDAVLVDVDRYLGAPFLLRYLSLPHVYYCHEPPRRFLEPICRPTSLPLSRWERARQLWRWPATRWLDYWSQRAERTNVRRARRVLTNSRYNRERIRRYYGCEATVCYLGVDGDFFTPDPAEERAQEILSVGALEPHKGFEFLLRAVARCRRRPPVRIVANSGHPRMRDHLMALAARLDVPLLIEMGISDRALRARYRRAALVAYTPHHEPFGLVPLEAMACGTPVIGVAEGGVRESIVHGQTGLLLPRDEKAMAAAIDELMADPARREAMGQAGRADVLARWTWEAAARRIEAQLTAQIRAG